MNEEERDDAADPSASARRGGAQRSGDSADESRSSHRRKSSRQSGGEGTGRGGRGSPGSTERRERVPLGTVVELPTGTITALAERRAGGARYIVEIDRVPAVAVSAEVIGELGLRVGVVVDERVGERLASAAAELAVFDKAVALLAVRARSVRDLQLRLRRAGATAPLVAKAIDRLTQLRLLDDEAYARNLARSRALSGGVSRNRIGQELQRRGVARDVAEEAVQETLDDVGLDEAGAAMEVARRRVRALRSLDVRKQRQRLYAFLARRGYRPDIISKVVAAVVGGGSDADDRFDAADGEETEVEEDAGE